MSAENSNGIQEERPGLVHRTASGAFWIMLENVGVQGIAFAGFAVLAHFISAASFGLISISYSLIYSLKYLFLDNVVLTMTRKLEATDLEYTTAFWITFLLGLLCWCVLYFFAPWIEISLHSPGLTPVLKDMSFIVIFLSLAQVPEAWQIRHFNFKITTIRSLVATSVGAVIGLVMAVRGYGVDALIAQQVIGSLVATVLLLLASRWKPGFRISLVSAKEIGHFVKTISINGVLYLLMQNGDIVLIAYFSGPSSVGIYNVGKRIVLAVSTIANSPVSAIASPSIAEAQTDSDRLHRIFLRGMTLLCAFSAPIFLGMAAVAPEAIAVVFGHKWVEAAPVLEILCLSCTISLPNILANSSFVVLKRQTWVAWTTFAYCVITVAGFAILHQMHTGLLALPFLMGYLFTTPVSALLVCRLMHIRLFDWIKSCAPGISASLIMFAAVKFLSASIPELTPILRLIILIPFGGVVYPVALWIVGRSTVDVLLDVGRKIIARKRGLA